MLCNFVTHTYNLCFVQSFILFFHTKGKRSSVKINHKYGWARTKYGNKARMKTQEDYTTAEKSW